MATNRRDDIGAFRWTGLWLTSDGPLHRYVCDVNDVCPGHLINGDEDYLACPKVPERDHQLYEYVWKSPEMSWGPGAISATLTNKPKQTLMSRLSTIARRFLDADTAALVDSGLFHPDLTLTEAGYENLNLLLVVAHREQLVARAKEIIAERTK